MTKRFAVVGDPVDHSRSPDLHRAAFRELGLPWEYDRYRVESGEMREFVADCDDDWGGLSVTMPLKAEALELADHADEVSRLAGAANTLRLVGVSGSREVHAYNTDVAGIEYPLSLQRLPVQPAAAIIGSGATARSAVIALARLGFAEVTIVARDLNRAQRLVDLAATLGLPASSMELANLDRLARSEVTLSTVPGHARVSLAARHVEPGDILFDIAYDVWPSANAETWLSRGGHSISGLSMLAAQALIQARLFVLGNPNDPLPDESRVRAAMNAAVGLDEEGLVPLSVG